MMSAETLKTVWHAVGLELVIFAATLLSALVIRGLSRAASPKACKEPRPSRASKGSESVKHASRPERVERLVQFAEDVVAAKDSRSALRALAAYAEIQSSLEGFPVHEVARHVRQGALELYVALVQCAIRTSRWHIVTIILDDMTAQEVTRPLSFYESLMKQLAGQKQFRLALDVYERLVSDGLQASCVTCSCIVSFAVEVGDLDRAVAYFQQLSSLCTPSIRAYMTVLRVHSKRRDWRSSVQVLRDMQRRGVKVDGLVLNVVLATGVAADQLDEAEALLADSECADVVSHNTVMKGHSQRNQPDRALEVLRRMRPKPNAISFNTAMDALVRCGRFREAWGLLEEMRAGGCRPDKFSCSILVKGVTKEPTKQQVDACLELLEDAGARCEPALQQSLYLSVLEAAAELETPRQLAATFARLRRQVTPTPAMYQILLRALERDSEPGAQLEALLGEFPAS